MADDDEFAFTVHHCASVLCVFDSDSEMCF